MANVTIETKAWNDPRFKILANKIRKSKFDAIGRVAALWEYCTERGKYFLTGAEINAVCELKHFSAALASDEVGLARKLTSDEIGKFYNAFLAANDREQPEQKFGPLQTDFKPFPTGKDIYYVSGTQNRIEWLTKLRSNGKKGGDTTAKKAVRGSNGRFLPSASTLKELADGPSTAWTNHQANLQVKSSVLIPTITTVQAEAAVPPPLGEGGRPSAPFGRDKNGWKITKREHEIIERASKRNREDTEEIYFDPDPEEFASHLEERNLELESADRMDPLQKGPSTASLGEGIKTITEECKRKSLAEIEAMKAEMFRRHSHVG